MIYRESISIFIRQLKEQMKSFKNKKVAYDNRSSSKGIVVENPDDCSSIEYGQSTVEYGQSTVEYAIILAAFLAVVLGLGALWHLFDTGLVVDHALQSASHHLQQVSEGALIDVFLY